MIGRSLAVSLCKETVTQLAIRLVVAWISTHKMFIQQRHTYDGQCKVADLSSMHGLRHRYAQMRYEALTERKVPTAGRLRVN